MRAGNALLVAGIAVVVAALSGASFANEEDGRAAPEVGAAAVGAEAEPPDTAEPQPAPVQGAADDPRDPLEAETAPVVAKDDGASDGRARDDDRAADAKAEKEPRANVNVKMKDISFKPKTVTVSPGDEVTWKNFDTAQHDAVGTGGADFETPLLKKGETAKVPFNESGTFDYFCSVHPTMKGKVVVRSSGSGGDSGGGGARIHGNTGGSTGSTDPGSIGNPTGTDSTFPTSGDTSSGGGGRLPNTGGVELPLLLFGSGLIVLGLLARAFHEHWIWR